ncbi:hypothetical protein M9H77_26091 [Catharanthus roseus]|uniref:Uncharacterized protein n=1 Tax=Catharanthus roseus TaxID=4058 RepID=A0ACC0A8R3_CATRO|nr:hypothetical protein M9H77_26091 [Catharanthus roseus]
MDRETNQLAIYQPNPTIGDIKTKPNYDPFCLFPKNFSFQIVHIFHTHNKISKNYDLKTKEATPLRLDKTEGDVVAGASRRQRIKGNLTIRTRRPMFTACSYASHCRGIFEELEVWNSG